MEILLQPVLGAIGVLFLLMAWGLLDGLQAAADRHRHGGVIHAPDGSSYSVQITEGRVRGPVTQWLARRTRRLDQPEGEPGGRRAGLDLAFDEATIVVGPLLLLVALVALMLFLLEVIVVLAVAAVVITVRSTTRRRWSVVASDDEGTEWIGRARTYRSARRLRAEMVGHIERGRWAALDDAAGVD